MADKKSANEDKLARLVKYVESLKQRLSGQLDKNLKEVLQIDLKKTEGQVAKLRG